MRGGDYEGYTRRFGQLSRLIPHYVRPQEVKIEKYVAGLPHEVRMLVSHPTMPLIYKEVTTRTASVTLELIWGGKLSKNDNKRKDVAESSDTKIDERRDHKRPSRDGKVFAVVVPAVGPP